MIDLRETPAAHLLEQYARFQPGDNVLQLGCGSGRLSLALAKQLSGLNQTNLWVMDILYSSLKRAEEPLKENNISNVKVVYEISLLPDLANFFDTALIELPKGRHLGRRWLVEAYACLKPRGQIYLAGANRAGIQSLVQDSQALFGSGYVVAYKKGNRVAKSIKQPGALEPGDPRFGVSWVGEPGILPGTWFEFEVETRGVGLKLRSLPGIFSYDKLDEGTALLLSTMEIVPGSSILDLGCGYGIIGILAARLGAGEVTMVDDNLLAIAAAKENIHFNELSNASVIPGDGTEVLNTGQYDLVVSNPPFHRGKKVDYQPALFFIMQASQALRPGGRLVLVANRFIRYEHQMRSCFSRVDRLAETGKYHIWQGIKED